MKALKRIWKNLKWLFNHPCTRITDVKPGDEKACDYCKLNNGAWQFTGFTICFSCMKKAFDKVLEKEKTIYFKSEIDQTGLTGDKNA